MLYDEHKQILINTINNMQIEKKEKEYLLELIEQKYIYKKLEHLEKTKEEELLNQYKQKKEELKLKDIYMKECEKIMKKNPKVSIIIPVYNGENYMREAIDSAINQTYKNIEIIVVNDGSKDRTEEIAKSYGDKIKYYKKENGGVSTALNLAISKMTGEYFSWLSHDDRYYPEKIETQIEYLRKNNLLDKKVITYTNYDVIDENSNVTNAVNFILYKPNDKPEYALLRGFVSGTALLIPKKAFEEHGVFNEQYRCIQDYLLFFEFMRDYKYIFIDKMTNSTRIHSKQVTNRNPNIVKENDFLWIYMQKELPDDAKIRLEGSLYKFYNEMYKFLLQHNNYQEAHKYSYEQAQKYLKIEQEKIDKIVSSKNKNEVYREIKNYYCKLDTAKNNENTFGEIINNIGFNNTVDYISKDLDEKWKNKYNILKDKYERRSYNYFHRFLRSVNKDGLVKTSFKLCKKIGSKIKRVIKKVLKITRKIICYIPKKIILFIINS